LIIIQILSITKYQIMCKMPIKTFTVKGKKYSIYRSQRKGKKYKVKVGRENIHFGAKGYKMYPSTKRGDNYCARSYGIKGKDNIKSANFWARKMWKCIKKKSKRNI